MVTISDVARRARVSTATVSRALNHPGRVDAATRAGVMSAVAELRYRPNEVARGLATRSSRTVGIVINLFEAPYYGVMLDGAVDTLRALGFHAIVESSGETADGEERAWDSLAGRQCEALIVHSDLLADARLTELMDEHPGAVLLNRPLAGFETRTVHLDNRRGGALAAERFAELGHRRLATITGRPHYFETRDRADGFRGALARRGLTLEPALEREGDFLERSGFEAMEALLDGGDGFTGVFCHNDEMATGALQACLRRGVAVPGDLSIIGFDDSRFARLVTPRLTTVRQPLERMGETAARLAHALAPSVTARDTASLPRVFDPELVERETTGPPPTAARFLAPTGTFHHEHTPMTMNFLDATLAHVDDGAELVLPNGAVLRVARTADLPPPGPIVVGLGPETLRVAAPWEPNTFLARVERVESEGEHPRLELDVAGQRVVVVDASGARLEPGVTVALAADPAAVRVFARRPDA